MPNFNSYKAAPFSVIFLVDGDRVLTLRRSENKKIYPGKISGFGGKIEPGENIETSARREFLEETGLKVDEMHLRGSFTHIIDNGYVNQVYIFVARGFSGKLHEISDEGQIEWLSVENILKNPNTADHVLFYLEQVIAGIDFYCGIAEYSQGKMISYSDNKSHFNERSNNQRV